MNRAAPTLFALGIIATACTEGPAPAEQLAPARNASALAGEEPSPAELPKSAVAEQVEPEAVLPPTTETTRAEEGGKLSILASDNTPVRSPFENHPLLGKAGALSGEVRGMGGLGLSGAGRGGGGLATGVGSLSAHVESLGNLKGDSFGGAALSKVQRQPEPPDFGPGESYKNHGTNKFTDPTEDRFSTFAIDVDTGSYTIARRKLNDGVLPPRDGVRVEEFVNYFSYDYAKPDGGAFSVELEAAKSPFATTQDTYLVRVGVQGKTIAESERKPVHLTFLVDVSGSMRRVGKLDLVKKSLQLLTGNLRRGDTVAIATYAGATQILLQPTGLDDRGRILDAIEGLSARGSTAMSSGLDLAYELAAKNFEAKHENRVIVLSDGDANVGRTGWEAMLKQIGSQVAKGVTLSTIGVGMGNYNDTLMEQLANHGNGNYFYVDSEEEAGKIFGDQLDGTLQVIAKDVKIQVEFDPEAVERYRLIGYENRDIADKDFRNDRVDAGEIGAGHSVTAMYEVVLKAELPERLATVRVRHKEPHGSDIASEQTFGLDRDELRDSIAGSSKDFQFAAAVCAFAEKLRHSPYAKGLTWDWIEEIASAATEERSDRKELVRLIKQARRVS